MRLWLRTSGFFVRCLVYYGILTLSWDGLPNAYRHGFCAVANGVFYRFGSAGTASFQVRTESDHTTDVTARVVAARGSNPKASVDLPMVYLGFRPTAFILSLVLATPLPWPRRLWALFGCLIGVSLFVLFRVWLQLFEVLANPDGMAAYSLGPFWFGVLNKLVKVFIMAPEFHYFAPAAIWAAVTFRRGDWDIVLGKRNPPATAPNQASKSSRRNS